MNNRLHKVLTWYLSPTQGSAEGVTQTSLGVLSTRREKRHQPVSHRQPLAA